jgi:hypothetical protein
MYVLMMKKSKTDMMYCRPDLRYAMSPYPKLQEYEIFILGTVPGASPDLARAITSRSTTLEQEVAI